MADEKMCFKCLCKKPIGDFYQHRQMADGRLNKCKDCTKNDARAHRAENLAEVRAYDRMRGSMPHRISMRMEYAKTEAGKLSSSAAKSKYEREHRDRKIANTAVNNAVRWGAMLQWPVCAVPDCAVEKTEAHHPDYGNPLGVVWLCKRHQPANVRHERRP